MLVGDDQYIPLTISLHEALQNLRAIADIGPKIFWVDQICINQVDIEERDRQVAMMGTIYKTATRVITYIGPEHPGDREGIQLIETVLYEISQEEEELYASLDALEAESLMERKFPAHESSVWDSGASILYRTWSTRVWMIQENVINQNTIMVCGTIAFLWSPVSTKLLELFFCMFPDRYKFAILDRKESLITLEKLPSISIGHIIYLRAVINEKGLKSIPLLDLLRMSRNFACKDPRDRIYAILGLASDVDALGIVRDYSKTAEEVFIDAAVRLLQANSVDLLNLVSNTKEIKLPSWVPDWSPPRSRLLSKPGLVLIPATEYCASGDTACSWNFNRDQSLLTVKGAVSDVIRTIDNLIINASLLAHEPDLALDEYPRMMQVLRKVCDDLGYKMVWDSSIPVNLLDSIPVNLLDPLSRTIIANQHFRGNMEGKEPSAFFTSYLNMYRFLYDTAIFRRDGGQQPQQPNTTTQAEASKFSEYAMIAEGRSLGVTENKRLCLVPSEARVGDNVAILLGGKTTYILRPIEGDRFEFLGEAYVHGLMNREALKDDNFQKRIREIRLV
jgi:hypothetical protein